MLKILNIILNINMYRLAVCVCACLTCTVFFSEKGGQSACDRSWLHFIALHLEKFWTLILIPRGKMDQWNRVTHSEVFSCFVSNWNYLEWLDRELKSLSFKCCDHVSQASCFCGKNLSKYKNPVVGKVVPLVKQELGRERQATSDCVT